MIFMSMHQKQILDQNTHINSSWTYWRRRLNTLSYPGIVIGYSIQASAQVYIFYTNHFSSPEVIHNIFLWFYSQNSEKFIIFRGKTNRKIYYFQRKNKQKSLLFLEEKQTEKFVKSFYNPSYIKLMKYIFTERSIPPG